MVGGVGVSMFDGCCRLFWNWGRANEIHGVEPFNRYLVVFGSGIVFRVKPFALFPPVKEVCTPRPKMNILLALLPVLVASSNPFSSNVIALTPKNFKQLENSPHVWFVNVCRQSWGYCGRLSKNLPLYSSTNNGTTSAFSCASSFHQTSTRQCHRRAEWEFIMLLLFVWFDFRGLRPLFQNQSSLITPSPPPPPPLPSFHFFFQHHTAKLQHQSGRLWQNQSKERPRLRIGTPSKVPTRPVW